MNTPEDFIPENMAASCSAQVKKPVPNKSSGRLGLAAIVFFAVVLIAMWERGLLETQNNYEAYRKAESHLKSRLPVGSRVSGREYLGKLGRDDWVEWSPGSVLCFFEVQEPRDNKKYDVTIRVTRSGRWWNVDP